MVHARNAAGSIPILSCLRVVATPTGDRRAELGVPVFPDLEQALSGAAFDVS